MTVASIRYSSVLGFLFLLGCNATPASDDSEVTAETRALTAKTITAKMSLPSGLDTAAFLVAQNKVQLGSGVDIKAAIWSAGSVAMQPDVKAQTVTCTGDVTLADRDTVTSITLGGRLVKGHRNAIGSVTRKALSNVSSSTSVTFPATKQSVAVWSGRSKTLDPGSYVNVNVSSGATLTLLAGDYYISKLTLEPAALLRLSPEQGATRIFIASSMNYRATMDHHADASQLFVEYLGTEDVVLETPFWGTMVAPRASLTIGTARHRAHRGSFMAQTITVQPYAKLEQVMFNPTGTSSSCAGDTWDPDGNPLTPCVAKTTCAPGSYVSAEGTTTTDRTCTGCASGQFSTTDNAKSCTIWSTCPAGTYVSNTPSATVDRVCADCPAGQTTKGENQSQCLPVATSCPAGTVQTGDTCTACAPGQYCAGGTSPQVACDAGDWDHDANPATECVAKTTCLAGTFVASEGTTTSDRVCTACAAGTFSTTSNAASCAEWTTCAPGTFVSTPPSATADRACSPCPDGQYSSGNNQANCLDQGACAAGSVQTAPGTQTSPPACAACEAGSFCAGGTSAAVVCAAGTWDHDGSAATPCVSKTACVPGNFVASEGSTVSDRVCSPCASGQFNTATNAPSCAAWADCAAGNSVSNQPSPTADRTCATCASGTFSSTTNAATCTAYTECSPGTYLSTAGTSTSNTVCTDCAAGTFSTTANAGSCQAWTSCPPDTYVSNTPSATIDRVCTACPTGQTSPGGGVTSCTTAAPAPLAVGDSHVCAVVSGGVSCWGDNYYAQLGDGTMDERHVPGPVSGLGAGVTALAAGNYHTCALINGGVQCWGDNSYGQLGSGSMNMSLVPVQVQGLQTGVTAIVAGAYHACAATSSGVRCWGMGHRGQLGNGTTTFSNPTPVTVSGIATAPTALAGGSAHTCAVVNGSAFCWGNNEDGAIGDGSKTHRTTPVQVSGLATGVNAMAANNRQTCALVGGSVRCWGYNMDGTLGDGTTTGRLTPVQVLGLESGVSTLASAGAHTCVVLGSGPMRCWGQAGSGELGDGSLTIRTSPTQVVGLTSGVTTIAVGNNNTCARVGASLQCWGQNFFGQIGDGTTTNRLLPTQVLFP